MTHFFLNLHMCGEVIPDPEGMAFENTDAAIKAATLEARALLADEVKAGKLCLDCHIEVVNCDTGEVVDVPFRSAVTIADC